MNSVGKPDAANPHVRFDERGRETEPLAKPQRHRALPQLYNPKTSLARQRRFRSAIDLLPSFKFVPMDGRNAQEAHGHSGE